MIGNVFCANSSSAIFCYTGSSRVEETNETVGKSASMKLEIQNLDKKEAISINEISSQEFSEVIRQVSIDALFD